MLAILVILWSFGAVIYKLRWIYFRVYQLGWKRGIKLSSLAVILYARSGGFFVFLEGSVFMEHTVLRYEFLICFICSGATNGRIH